MNVGAEHNIPAWYSSALLLLCAILLAVTDQAKRALGDRYSLWWAGLALEFTVLSLDEATGLHEKIPRLLARLLDDPGIVRSCTGPAALLLVALLAVYAPFLLRLPAHARHLFALSGGIYVAGVLGVEYLGQRLILPAHGP